MRVQAEVTCYHCGRAAGTWEWLTTASAEWGLFRPPGDATATRAILSRQRCAHCGGPVFLDEMTQVARPVAIDYPALVRRRAPKDAERLVS